MSQNYVYKHIRWICETSEWISHKLLHQNFINGNHNEFIYLEHNSNYKFLAA